MSAGEAIAGEELAPARLNRRPSPPGEGEAILWQGRPRMLVRKLWELAGFLLLLGLLTWAAVGLIRPHLSGSQFAGQPDNPSMPLILLMVAGMVMIIALPVWLRSSARARAHYMLTSRRALVWVGGRIAGEAQLFGAEMESGAQELRFSAPHMYLSWRLKDEGADRLRFEQIADAPAVAALAEEHGARWLNRPEDEQAGGMPSGG
jgi:hypothetical protein